MWGWEADASGSLAQARDLFGRRRYDLALCDADLPDGDGVSFSQELQETDDLLDIIIVSGDPENIERARRAGFYRCLSKPFNLDALRVLADGAASERIL
jgi:DNA-binding response OmpR family regulator